MSKYNTALIWLIRLEYDVKTTLIGKTEVKIELWQKNTLLKSETVPFTTETVKYIHNKIIVLYEHFNLPSKSLRQ